MSSQWKPTAEHRTVAVERLLSGLARGDDVFELSKEIANLHPPDNTFPGEVFISLARSPASTGSPAAQHG